MQLWLSETISIIIGVDTTLQVMVLKHVNGRDLHLSLYNNVGSFDASICVCDVAVEGSVV